MFDLDGVVVRTLDFHIRAWERLASENNWSFGAELHPSITGIPRLTVLEMILKANNADLPDEEMENLSELKNSYFLEYIKKIGKRDLVSGALKFIDRLRKGNYLTALCSSSKSAQLITDRLDIGDKFHTIVTGWDITAEKPDPQIYLLAAERLVVSPRVCIVIEDTTAGIEAAHAAGMAVIGLGDKDRLKKADYVADGYDEIPWEDIVS